MSLTIVPTPQYVVQHEFDNEPTYVAGSADKQLEDKDCVAFGSRLPVKARLRLAQHVCDELNRIAIGQQLDPQLASAARTSVTNHATGQATLVISVSGGVVQEVLAEQPAPRVILVDWDTEACDEGANVMHFMDAGGLPVFAWVVEMPTGVLTADDCDVCRMLAAAGIVIKPQISIEGIRDPATLNTGELVDFVSRIQAILYLDILGDREFWNPDKEWEGADLLDELALVMHEYQLAPPHISDAPL